MGHTYDKVFTKRKRKQKFNPSREILEEAVEEFKKNGGKITKVVHEVKLKFHNSYRSPKATSFEQYV